MEELAENFFCHMHDHNHNEPGDEHESHETDLTEELNPLRNSNKLRKSILNARTFLILNTNHIKIETFRVEKNLELLCANCSHSLGFKSIFCFVLFLFF